MGRRWWCKKSILVRYAATATAVDALWGSFRLKYVLERIARNRQSFAYHWPELFQDRDFTQSFSVRPFVVVVGGDDDAVLNGSQDVRKNAAGSNDRGEKDITEDDGGGVG